MGETLTTLEHSAQLPMSQWVLLIALIINSKKTQLRHITALGLAGNASAEDTRTMIEDKLREMDREPVDVQVVVQDTQRDGMFI